MGFQSPTFSLHCSINLTGDTPSVLTEIMSDLSKLSEEVHKFAFEMVFAQLKNYLADLSTMEIWTSQSSGGALTSDLPSFSLAPQEYITKVGVVDLSFDQPLIFSLVL